MTKEGERKLAAAFETTFGGLEQAIEQVPALLGAYIDGQKFIVVTDQPDYVWCRIGGNESRRVKAFNQHAGGVAQHFDLPIIIVKDKLNSNVWKVIGRDITRYPDWGQVANYPYSSPYIAHHGADHSFSSQAGMGADPVWVFKRQMMPLLPHPAVSGSMGIEIGSDFYYFDGSYRWFASTGTVDFTPALPTGAVNGRFMTVYIDGTTGNPAYITGTEFNAVTPPIDPGEFIEIPSADQGVAVAAVFLLTGTARLGWGEIYDLRWPHRGSLPTGIVFQGSSGLSFVNTVLFQGNLGVAGDIHVTGSVFSGLGSFHTVGQMQASGAFTTAAYLDTLDQASEPASPASGYGRFYSLGQTPFFKTAGGSVIDLSAVGGGGGAGADQNVAVFDDGVFQVTGTVSFEAGIDVAVTGSVAYVTAPAGSGDFVRLADVLLLADGTFNISFTTGTYISLVVEMSLRSDVAATADAALIRFNGDSGNNYDSVIWAVNADAGGAGSSGDGPGVSHVRGFTTGDNAPSDVFASLTLRIPDYANTNKHKTCHGDGYYLDTASAGSMWRFIYSSRWRNSAAIGSIQITPENGTNWLAGSRATVYGLS